MDPARVSRDRPEHGLFCSGFEFELHKDSAGNTVNLRLLGPGFMDHICDTAGDGETLNLENVVPGRSTLTGTVTKGRFG